MMEENDLSSLRQAFGSYRAAAGVRWWPAMLIVCGAAAAIAWLWLEPDAMRQRRVVGTLTTVSVSCVLLLLWACLFSRMPSGRRWAVVFFVTVGLALLAGSVKIRGVTGDLVPILAFRWTPEAADMELELDAGTGRERAAAGGDRTEESGASTSDEPRLEAEAREIGALDFPQFLGRERRAVVRGVHLARGWETRQPRILWRRPIGAGWSSFALAGSRAYTQEQRREEELVTCYDLTSGRLLWAHSDRARFSSTIAGDGPRATPALTAERIYALGARGLLNCLERRRGKPIWSRNILEDAGAELPEWGKSCSPLVTGDLVVVSAGGGGGKSLVAYRKDSGEPVWSGGDGRSSYSSPVLGTLAGREQILILNHGSLAAHDPLSGAVLWTHPWAGPHPKVPQPVILSGDRVFLTSGYGLGCALLEVRAGENGNWAVSELWRNRNLKSKFNNVVAKDGFIYGLDDGILVCLDLADGERRWKGGRYGHGQMLLVEDLLLVTSEYGELVLIDPSPEALRELGRFRAFDDRTWPCPSVSGPFVVWRSDKEAASIELPLAEADD